MSYYKSWTSRQDWGGVIKVDNSSTSVNRYTTNPSARSGSSNPKWREQTRANEQAATEYQLSTQKVSEFRKGSFVRKYSYVGRPLSFGTRVESFTGIYAPAIGLAHHSAASLNKAGAIALSKIYKKLESEMSHLNSPAVLAEFLDVLRQFGRPLQSIVDLTHRHHNRLELARRGLSGSTAFKRIKWQEVVASTYLEWSFGLSPLLQDATSLAEAVRRWQDEATEDIFRELRSKIASRGMDTSGDVQSYNEVPSQCNFRFAITTSRKTEARAQYVVGLQGDVRADFGSNDRLLQLLGFNHANWVPAVYEAVPWSWLLDYFTNVQEILQAGAVSTARVKWIVKTLSTRSSFVRDCVADPVYNHSPGLFAPLSSEKQGTGGGSLTAILTDVVRTLPQTLGVPPLYIEHPFNEWKKVANLIAVMNARRQSANALWMF